MTRRPGTLLALFALFIATKATAEESAASGAAPPTQAAPPPQPPAPPAVAQPPAPPAVAQPPFAPQPAVLSVVPAPPPTQATVHVAIDYANAWLEGRSRVDLGEWKRLCAAPCDRSLGVDGLELRVTAPGMTTSNTFVVEPGGGTARLRVSGGSSTARGVGIAGLVTGLPIAFVGMTLFGLGTVEDERDIRTAGVVTLGVGAAAVIIALPLLLVGATTVRNERGKYIAERRFGVLTF